MEPLNEKSQIAQEYGLLPADARQQLIKSQISNMRRYISFSSDGLKSYFNESLHNYHFILGKYLTISFNSKLMLEATGLYTFTAHSVCFSRFMKNLLKSKWNT